MEVSSEFFERLSSCGTSLSNNLIRASTSEALLRAGGGATDTIDRRLWFVGDRDRGGGPSSIAILNSESVGCVMKII